MRTLALHPAPEMHNKSCCRHSPKTYAFSRRLRAGALAVEAGYDGRVTEASPRPAGQPAYLAPEIVRCTRGRVTYSAAGAEGPLHRV